MSNDENTTDVAEDRTDLITAAKYARDRAEEMGYDGVRSVEALPDFLKALEKIGTGRITGAKEHCEDTSFIRQEIACDALAQARKED